MADGVGNPAPAGLRPAPQPRAAAPGSMQSRAQSFDMHPTLDARAYRFCKVIQVDAVEGEQVMGGEPPDARH